MSLLAVVAFLIAGSLPPLLVRRRSASVIAWSAAAPTLAAFALLAAAGPAIFAGEVMRGRWEWMPQLGLAVSLRADGLAWTFGMLVLGIGLLIQLYARYYLSGRDALGRFYATLMLFTASMTGLVLSGNLVLLAAFWELTSLTSFLLIGYWHGDVRAREAARTALVVTGLGGLALLAGVLLLGRIVGSMELDAVLAAGPQIRASPLYVPMLVLILAGAFTKSAQIPFHFWLPAAMAAPTPVSAYLHSATMVKAGVFLLARLFPVLAGTPEWFWLVTGVGIATLVFGAYAALWEHDIKGLLAYSTISHLGLITMLFGLGTATGAIAGVFHILNHATFKASLFMAAGIIDHETGTRDMRVLRGLSRVLPVTSALAIVAAAAMAGVPLLNGFLSKEMLFAAVIESPGGAGWFVPAAATAGAALGVGYSLRFIMSVFFGRPVAPLPREPHEPPRFMRVPVELLVVLCILVGVAPAFVMGPTLEVAAASVFGGPLPAFSLHLWHGFNVPLLMSVLALVGGTLLFMARGQLFACHDRWLPAWEARTLFERVMAATMRVAARVTRALENGSLQRYTALLIGAALVVAVPAGMGARRAWAVASPTPMDWPAAAGLLILVAATAGTVFWHRRRFTAVVCISAVGLIVSLGFVRLSAPDLALTQLLVEMVTILLLLLVLHYLPATGPARSTRRRQVRDAGIALACGAGVGALAWAVLTRARTETIAGYFVEQSLPRGGGTNIVNVILVDFRGFDTLGEIAVIAIAALGVLVLLERVTVPRVEGDGAQPLESFAARHPLLLSAMTRPLLPLVVLASLFILLRGHNLPGGGFVAGLLVATGLIVQYMASGIEWASRRITLDFRYVLGAGVLLAAGTGAAALLFGQPFLTSAYQYAELPLIGKVPLSSAFVFDVGVYLTVIGAVLLILKRLGRMGEAHARAQARRSGESEAVLRNGDDAATGGPWSS